MNNTISARSEGLNIAGRYGESENDGTKMVDTVNYHKEV